LFYRGFLPGLITWPSFLLLNLKHMPGVLWSTIIIINWNYPKSRQIQLSQRICLVLRFILYWMNTIVSMSLKIPVKWPTGWPRWLHQPVWVLLNILNNSTKSELPVIITNLIKDKLSLFAPLSKGMTWNKFGYTYFNPKDRNFLSSLFKQSYLASDRIQTTNCLNQIFI